MNLEDKSFKCSTIYVNPGIDKFLRDVFGLIREPDRITISDVIQQSHVDVKLDTDLTYLSN